MKVPTRRWGNHLAGAGRGRGWIGLNESPHPKVGKLLAAAGAFIWRKASMKVPTRRWGNGTAGEYVTESLDGPQ